MNKIPLETIITNPENERAQDYATVRLLENGELYVINGRHRLMAQLEASGLAKVMLAESGKIVHIQRFGDKLIVTAED